MGRNFFPTPNSSIAYEYSAVRGDETTTRSYVTGRVRSHLNTPRRASALSRGHRRPQLVISTRLRSIPVRSTALLSPVALESVPKMLFCTSKILSLALPGGSMDLPD